MNTDGARDFPLRRPVQEKSVAARDPFPADRGLDPGTCRKMSSSQSISVPRGGGAFEAVGADRQPAAWREAPVPAGAEGAFGRQDPETALEIDRPATACFGTVQGSTRADVYDGGAEIECDAFPARAAVVGDRRMRYRWTKPAWSRLPRLLPGRLLSQSTLEEARMGRPLAGFHAGDRVTFGGKVRPRGDTVVESGSPRHCLQAVTGTPRSGCGGLQQAGCLRDAGQNVLHRGQRSRVVPGTGDLPRMAEPAGKTKIGCDLSSC